MSGRTGRIGHQIFTVSTRDSFCLLLFHITKTKKTNKKKRRQWGWATPEFPEQFRTAGQTLSQVTRAEGRSSSLRRRLFHFPEIPPQKQQTPLQEQLPQFRTFPTLFLMCHKTFFFWSHTPAWPKGNALGLVPTTIRDLGTSGKKNKILF